MNEVRRCTVVYVYFNKYGIMIMVMIMKMATEQNIVVHVFSV